MRQIKPGPSITRRWIQLRALDSCQYTTNCVFDQINNKRRTVLDIEFLESGNDFLTTRKHVLNLVDEIGGFDAALIEAIQLGDE